MKFAAPPPLMIAQATAPNRLFLYNKLSPVHFITAEADGAAAAAAAARCYRLIGRGGGDPSTPATSGALRD